VKVLKTVDELIVNWPTFIIPLNALVLARVKPSPFFKFLSIRSLKWLLNLCVYQESNFKLVNYYFVKKFLEYFHLFIILYN